MILKEIHGFYPPKEVYLWHRYYKEKMRQPYRQPPWLTCLHIKFLSYGLILLIKQLETFVWWCESVRVLRNTLPFRITVGSCRLIDSFYYCQTIVYFPPRTMKFCMYPFIRLLFHILKKIISPMRGPPFRLYFGNLY